MTLDEKVDELMMDSAVRAAERLPTFNIQMCGSEIEQLMMLALWSRGSWTDRVKLVETTSLDELIKSAKADDTMFRMAMSQQVVVGKYRLDFLLVGHRRFMFKDMAMVAVECDGHDFHEKTKEQAAKDKARDRYLAGRGITVLRFTGSEIWRDAGACADEAIDIVEVKLVEDMRASGEARRKLFETAEPKRITGERDE